MMWLFAGFSTWLTEETADGTDAFTLFFSFLLCCRPSTSLLAWRSGFSVHQRRGGGEEGEEVGCSDQWQETRRLERKM